MSILLDYYCGMRILVNDFAGHSFQVALSRHMAKNGHTVLHTFFAGNNTPMGVMKALPGDPDGFSILGLTIPGTFKKHSLLSRRRSDIAYGHAVAKATEHFQPDVVISANMPLNSQAILQTTTRNCGAKFVFSVQDIYSEAVGFVLRKKRLPFSGMVSSYFREFEKRLLLQSDAIVCIAPEFRELLQSWGISGPLINVIENWAPIAEVPLRPKSNPWSKDLGIDNSFSFIYSGTLGMKHKPDLLLALAKQIRDRPNVTLTVIAQGAGADWLRANRADIPPETLRVMDFQPYEKVPEVLGSADTLIVLLDSECGGFAVPSKTLSYLCAGRPILIASPPENLACKIIANSESGLAVASDDEQAFLQAAELLVSDEALRSKLGRNARSYAERKFDLEGISKQFLTIFENVASRRGITPTLRAGA